MTTSLQRPIYPIQWVTMVEGFTYIANFFRMRLELSSLLWDADVPLLICSAYGMIGSMQLSLREHTSKYLLDLFSVLSMHFSISAHLSVGLSDCLPSLHLSVHFFSVYPHFLHMSVYLSVHWSMCLYLSASHLISILI